MRAFASIRGPDDRLFELGHGDLIGRLRSAALSIDDPRVSEAHAIVSLRGDRLKLLALRGRLYEAGATRAEIDLRDGLEVGLGHGLALTVEEVFLPETVLAVEADGLPRQVLQSVSSIYLLPRPRIVPGFGGDADATIWGDGADWRASVRGGPARALEVGVPIDVGGLEVRVVEVALAQSGALGTLGAPLPIRLVVSYDTAEIHAGDRVLLLSGVAARLLSELVAFDGPTAWETLAAEVWGREVDRDQLRSRFDMAVLRLRKRLREAAIREELVATTGTGQVQLLLKQGDVVDARM